MAQHDYVIANGTGAAVRSDLNGALAAIVTQNSGATAPATTYAYMWWADTTTGLLKIRNAANNAWVTIGSLSAAGFGLLAAGDTLTAALGSASTPGITFTGDLNTGIYSPGADQVAISINGAQRVTVDSSGRVLVGTSSSPSVGDSIYSYLIVQGYPGGASANANISLQRGETAANITSGEQIGDINFTDSAGYSFAKISCLADANAGVNDYPGRLQFWTTADGASSPTERMRLDSSGRLGIGTTSPQRTLSVSKAGAEGVEWNPGQSSNVNTEVHYNRSGAAFCGISTQAAYHVFDLASSEAARIDSSGRLLVGTSTALTGTNPQYAKLVSIGNTAGGNGPGMLALGASSAASGIASGDNIGRIFFTDNAAGEYANITCQADAAGGTNDYPGRLVLSTTADGASSPTERMRITQAGFTKHSSTGSFHGPTGSYHEFVSGSAASTVFCRNTNAAAGGIEMYYDTAINNTVSRFFWGYDSGATRMEVRSNGGIANFQANNVNLSDINTKKDISPAAGTWDCIKEWEIVNYRYKDQPDDADLNLGVIAQQVAESCPEVITVFSEAKDAKPAVLDDDGNEVEPAQEAQPERLGVKEQQMYWMAIKALQEAQVRIEALEAEVAALKAQ